MQSRPQFATLVAFHEAGHYVVACAVGMGRNVRCITLRPSRRHLASMKLGRRIAPDGVRQMLGGKSWRACRGNPYIAAALACVYVEVGGRVAESILLREAAMRREYLMEDVYGDAHDDELQRAFDYLAALEGRPRPTRPGRLLPTLEAEFARVRRWMRRHWRHVAAVARALLRERRLSRDRLDALMSRLPPIDSAVFLLPRGWITQSEYRRFCDRRFPGLIFPPPRRRRRQSLKSAR